MKKSQFLTRLKRLAASLLTLLLILFAGACAPKEQAPTYHNPLIRQRADPWIYKHTDGYYYFTASVPEFDRIELRRAKTINDLASAEPTVIWEHHLVGEMSRMIWAPELHYFDGKWYLYFSASHTTNVMDHRIYVLECTNENPLEGEWLEKGKLDTGVDSFALDATAFALDNQLYLLWAQQDRSIEGNSNIYIAKLKNPWTMDGNAVMLTYPEYEWERREIAVTEGPAALIHDGKIFVTYSASATDANYCMGMLWADVTKNLLDPSSWQKSDQPVFATSKENGQFGPGHNSFTIAEDGKTDLLVYHAREYAKITGNPLDDPNRNTRVQPFTWDENGMPVFGSPLPNADQTKESSALH